MRGIGVGLSDPWGWETQPLHVAEPLLLVDIPCAAAGGGVAAGPGGQDIAVLQAVIGPLELQINRLSEQSQYLARDGYH